MKLSQSNWTLFQHHCLTKSWKMRPCTVLLAIWLVILVAFAGNWFWGQYNDSRLSLTTKICINFKLKKFIMFTFYHIFKTIYKLDNILLNHFHRISRGINRKIREQLSNPIETLDQVTTKTQLLLNFEK